MVATRLMMMVMKMGFVNINSVSWWNCCAGTLAQCWMMAEEGFRTMMAMEIIMKDGGGVWGFKGGREGGGERAETRVCFDFGLWLLTKLLISNNHGIFSQNLQWHFILQRMSIHEDHNGDLDGGIQGKVVTTQAVKKMWFWFGKNKRERERTCNRNK